MFILFQAFAETTLQPLTKREIKLLSDQQNKTTLHNDLLVVDRLNRSHTYINKY